MVRGHPFNREQADPILDTLVRETFLFIKDNPDNIRERQPDSYKVKTDYDEGLTAALKKAELLSEGYVAVLSGTPIKAEEFNGGHYRLCVYNTADRPMEREGVNSDLDIELKVGAEPGIENAIGHYNIVGSKTVFFEEERVIVEGWTGNDNRKISISRKMDLNRQPNAFLFGEAPEGKSLIGSDGKPVKEYLFSQHQIRLGEFPAGTVFILDPNNDRKVDVYIPK